jgi:flagellin-like hook-associated protein FlgL
MVYAALFQGLRPKGPLMANLAQRKPDNLMGLMDKVDEYINQEQTLRAMIGSRKNQASTSQNPDDKLQMLHIQAP